MIKYALCKLQAKNAMDLVFLFWSISVGIICGAGLAEIAVILSLVLSVGIFILNLILAAKAPMLLVINASCIDSEEGVLLTVKKHSGFYKVKSRNLSADSLDMVIEVRPDNESALIREVAGIQGVLNTSLVSHDGEATF